MALPKIDVPIYRIELPLSKKQIAFRPFNVKEQRNLLMALDSEDADEIWHNISQVLNNCIQTEGIDIERLPLIDVEYYFLQLRAKSVGEVSENNYECNNIVDGVECKNIISVSVNILDIKPTIAENTSEFIQLSSKLIVKLKYPEFALMNKIKDANNVSDFAFNMIAESIENIFDGEQYYYAKETDPVELVEFVESLPQAQFEQLEEFFNNMPRMVKHIEFKCKKCGYEHSLDVEGLESFFV